MIMRYFTTCQIYEIRWMVDRPTGHPDLRLWSSISKNMGCTSILGTVHSRDGSIQFINTDNLKTQLGVAEHGVYMGIPHTIYTHEGILKGKMGISHWILGFLIFSETQGEWPWNDCLTTPRPMEDILNSHGRPLHRWSGDIFHYGVMMNQLSYPHPIFRQTHSQD